LSSFVNPKNSFSEIQRRRSESCWERGTSTLGMRNVSLKCIHLTNQNNQRPNGVRFSAPAGTTEFANRWQPQPGDVVSFKHRGFLHASQKPKLPTLYRLRHDLSWEDVCRNWKDHKRSSTSQGKRTSIILVQLVTLSLFPFFVLFGTIPLW